jgi:hypothetical protein
MIVQGLNVSFLSYDKVFDLLTILAYDYYEKFCLKNGAK